MAVVGAPEVVAEVTGAPEVAVEVAVGPPEVAEAAVAAPGAGPVRGPARVREPALGRAQGWTPVPGPGPVPVAQGEQVAGRVLVAEGAPAAARLQTVSCPGPTAFPQFAGIAASHLGRG